MGFSGQLWPIFENKGEKGDKGDQGDPGLPAPHANLTGEVTSIGNETTVTNSAVINKLLTGFSAAAGIVAAADSIITAFNKIVGNLALKAPLLSPSFTTPALGTPASGNLANCSFPTLNQNTNGSSGSCTGNAATATTAGACSGNAATATTASACSGNAATSSSCSGNAATATTAANLNGAWAQMPTGTRLVFAQAAAPTGWTQVVDDGANNRMLRVVNTAGGGIAGTHSPISCSVVAAHTHGFTTGTNSVDHTHTTTTGTESVDHTHTTTTGANSVGHTHTFTGAAMAAHDHAVAAHSHTVPGVLTNTGGTQAPRNYSGGEWFTTITSSSVTANITPASAGTPAGTNAANSVSHTHTGTSGGRSAGHTHTGTSAINSVDNTHSGSTDNGSSSTNWTPRYIDTIICSKS